MTHPGERPVPRYVGFAEAEPNLYEFRAESGVYVALHEMECVEIRYLPLTRILALTFDGDPTEVMSAMTVTLTFAETEISSWQANDEAVDQEVVESNPRVRGQVGNLHAERAPPDNSPGVSFHLSLLDLAVGFFATEVRCEVWLAS